MNTKSRQNKRYAQIEKILLDVKGDFSKFYDGDNKAAGVRVRKAMQEIKNMAQNIRVEVQTIKNNA